MKYGLSFFPTDFTIRMDDLARSADWDAFVKQRVPLQRAGTDEEIGRLIAWMCSPDAAYMTGQVYTMDGAETAGGLASR